MTDQPPILSYQSPVPMTPNFGMRAAKVCWLAPLAAAISFSIAVLLKNLVSPLGIIGVLLWIVGLVSGIVALTTMQRYGRKGILRPAVIGLCLTLAVLVLGGCFVFYALCEAGAAAAR